MGAFEQLFGPVKRESEKKNSNGRGIPRGRGGEMFKLRFDWRISSFKNEGKKENNLKDREVERKKEE